MNLVVSELGLSGDFGNANELFLQFKPTENLNIVSIRPHLYIEDTPAGSLFLQVLDLNKRLIKQSNTVAISSITTATYFHGFVKFDLNLGLQKDQSYYLALKSSGYTYGASSFVGWCNSFDSARRTENFEVAGVTAAYELEIWTKDLSPKGEL